MLNCDPHNSSEDKLSSQRDKVSLGTSLLSYSQVLLYAHGSSFFKVGYP